MADFPGGGVQQRLFSGLLTVLILTAAGCTISPLPPASLGGIQSAGYEAPGTIRYPPEVLSQVAAALATRGYYEENRLPVYGIALQNALRGFQTRKGLAVTGRIDAETLLALELDIDPSLLSDARGQNPAVKPHPDLVSQLLANLTTPRPIKSDQSGVSANAIGSFSEQSAVYHQGAAVAALIGSEGVFCSGFLIGPDLLLTTSDCVNNADRCDRIQARFNFQAGPEGEPLTTADYQCREILKVNETLNYALLRLEGQPGYDWGVLELSSELDEGPITVIGHPADGMKQARRDCRILFDKNPASEDLLSSTCEDRVLLPGAIFISQRDQRVMGISSSKGNQPSLMPMRQILADCHLCEPISSQNLPLDLEKNGKSDLLLQGYGMLGILKNSQTGFEVEWLDPGWLTQWNLHEGYFAYVTDVDGDGPDDVLLKNSKWLAILKGTDGKLMLHWMTHDHVGRWQLGLGDRALPGDFNGDGRDDLLIGNDGNIALLLSNGNKLICRWISEKQLGTWRFHPGDEYVVGDFNGDGLDDLLACNGDRVGLFTFRDNRLEQVWMVSARLGSWPLHGTDSHYVGDFNGDQCDEILVHNDTRMALWGAKPGGPEVHWLQRGRIGSWRLGWQDRLKIADFNGDGRDDVLIRSHEWIGLLISSGRFFSNTWIQYDRFGGWDLTPFDHQMIGDFNGDGKADVFMTNPWGNGRFLSTGTSLYSDLLRRKPLPWWKAENTGQD